MRIMLSLAHVCARNAHTCIGVWLHSTDLLGPQLTLGMDIVQLIQRAQEVTTSRA